MKRSRIVNVGMLMVVATTIGCDQVSKRLAAEHLMGVPQQCFLGDTVRLEYADNTGAFLSLGAGLPPWARAALFIVGTGIILIVGGVVALRHRWQPVRMLGMALVGAGGVSNLVDRIARGSVIDFLNVGIGPVRTGIFNVADMAIMLGAGLLLLPRGHAAEPPKAAER